MVSGIEKEAQLLNSVQALIKAQSTRMSLYKEFNELSKTVIFHRHGKKKKIIIKNK